MINIKLTHNLDFIDAVRIVAKYFRSTFAPFFTTIVLLHLYDEFSTSEYEVTKLIELN